MSGVKYSEIELAKERQAQEKARERIGRLNKEYKSVSAGIERLLAELGSQVVKSFSEISRQVSSWRSFSLPMPGKGMNSDELNSIADRISDLCKQAGELQRSLIYLKEQGRDERARELYGRIEQNRNRVNGLADLLNKWRKGESEKCMARLDKFSNEIEQGQFVDVEQGLNTFESGFSKLDQAVSELEMQDMQRHVVLDALIDVCSEMGWEIEDEPVLKRKNDPASDILFSVDTFSAGKMAFCLSLQGIRVDAPFSTEGRLCYRQFDDFSDRLKKYGIKTNFKKIDGPDDLPEDRVSDALDIEDADDEGYMEA